MYEIINCCQCCGDFSTDKSDGYACPWCGGIADMVIETPEGTYRRILYREDLPGYRELLW